MRKAHFSHNTLNRLRGVAARAPARGDEGSEHQTPLTQHLHCSIILIISHQWHHCWQSLQNCRAKRCRLRRSPIMKFHDQNRSYPVGAQFIGAPPMYRPLEGIDEPLADNDFSRSRSVMGCHPERSEGSLGLSREILRFAQDDMAGFGRETSSSAVRAYMRLLRHG